MKQLSKKEYTDILDNSQLILMKIRCFKKKKENQMFSMSLTNSQKSK